MKHEDQQKRIPASGITIITEIETETVLCKWCDGDGLVMGVSDRFHTEISCVYCDGLGTLTREYERKYIVLPDGSKELFEREG
ncbi:hypothetical protein AGMMS49983_10110 [Clostridia bacterium]|nr:hypothetical protein AGMMS49983_10110 [Clostridia bacterium]